MLGWSGEMVEVGGWIQRWGISGKMEGWEMDLGRELEIWGMEASGVMSTLGWTGTLRNNLWWEEWMKGDGTLSHWG